MGTRPTGSDLISIESERLTLTISGNASHPSSDVSETDKCSQVNIRKIPAGAKACVLDEEVVGTKINCIPLFFEQRNYEVHIEFNKDDDVRFVHDNDNVANKIKRKGSKYPTLGGVINFNNDIGYSTIGVEVNGKLALSIEIEVFPSKIDYQDDYKAMIGDITAEVYNLAFGLIQKTYQNAGITATTNKQSPVEYLALFEYIYDKLCGAMTVIESYPHHKLEKYKEVVPAYKVRKCDKDTIKWMNRHPGKTVRDESRGRTVFEKVEVTKKKVNVDTFENRLVKHILNSTYKKLVGIKGIYLGSTNSGFYEKTTSKSLENKINSWCSYLSKKTEFSFLKNVSDLGNTQSLSLVFAMAPGYRELYKCYLMLQKGLSLFGDLYKLSLKDVALLYEYWCFIKLNSIVNDMPGYQTKQSSPISIDRGGMFVTIKKGRASVVDYVNGDGDKISLAYNREYTRSEDGPILTQKPDNVFSLIKENGSGKYEYIFDAKYKINMAQDGSDYRNKYGAPGPQEQDINTMHRYRDAIVHRNNETRFFERDMYGAYVLFPYDDADKKYIEHDFYKSIEAVNVGALPFLPSNTVLVKEFIDKLINDKDADSTRRVIMPAGKVDVDYKIGKSIVEHVEKR